MPDKDFLRFCAEYHLDPDDEDSFTAWEAENGGRVPERDEED
jgi:hypothetical protein